jgi:MFS family permease
VVALLTDQPFAASDAGADRRRRVALAGLVLVITVVAIEALAVATAMPTVARSLHGINVFGWSFTAYLLADIVGMVDAGARVDRAGPRASLVGGLALFGAGLLVDGLAPDIWVFLLGRALQGLGGGAVIVAVYVVVARVFPEAQRPRVFAAFSAAWVLPALLGPAVAGAVTDAFGWRWVFLGIAPLAALAAVLLLPVMRASGGGTEGSVRRLGTAGGVVLAVGLGLTQLAGQRLDASSIPLLVVGLAGVAVPLVRVLPAGSLRLRPGLPSLVLLRGVFSVAFFGAEAYLPLTLSKLHHGSPTAVGIPLTLGAVGWAIGSWWQGHGDRAQHPARLMRAGFVLVGAAVAALVSLTFGSVTMWLAAPLWAVAGAGMGLGYPTVSVTMLRLSPAAEQGANTAALQICDVIGSVAGVALAATLVAVAGSGHLATAMRLADPVLASVTVFGLVVVSRALRSDVETLDVEPERA